MKQKVRLSRKSKEENRNGYSAVRELDSIVVSAETKANSPQQSNA